MIAPKPKDLFWQAAAGDRGDRRRSNPRAAIPGSGHAPGHRPTRVRDAGGRRRGKGRRRRSVREADHAGRGAELGTCGVLGDVASRGGGRHALFGLSMIIIIPVAPRSDLRFRAGTIAFAPACRPPGPGQRSGSTGRDRTTGRDRRSPPQTRHKPRSLLTYVER